MPQKLSKVLLFSLLLSVSIFQLPSAKAVEILWNPGVSNDLSGSSTGLVPGAGIRNTGLLVNKSNPDELIMKIIMKESFEDRPFSGKGRNMAMWIYWPKDYCWSKESANCEGLFTVGDPINPATYPSSKGSEYVFVQKHDKASNVNVTASSCKAHWWIESTFQSRDTWAFAVSITCLGIPKEFGWYAFSQIDIGQENVVSDFTTVQTITYPFHELAAIAAKKPQTSTSTSGSKQVCVTATSGAGYTTEGEVILENCSDSKTWELILCVGHPKSDLQVFKNKKWKKVKTLKTIKDSECGDEVPYSYTVKSTLNERLRVKSYGNEKQYETSYIDLKVSRK
jgi:hypothetical protein